MSKHHEREKWIEDIEARQRNIVFPDTVQNEARFWRNLGKTGGFNTRAKIGLAIFAIWVIGLLVAFFGIMVRNNPTWKRDISSLILITLVVFGPIFAAIVWATNRALRNAHRSAKNPKH